MENLSFAVCNAAGSRIDAFISDQLPDMSRNRIKNLIDDDKVKVDGKNVKPSYKLKEGQTVSIEIPDPVETVILPEDISLDIIFENDDYLIVNKPKQMSVHPGPGHYSGTLVNALMYHCKDSLSGINGELRPGIVHRIDMDTTGALIVCKNDKAHNFIAEQLAEHSITRKYLGIIIGTPKEYNGTINKPIGRHPTDRKKMSVLTKNGKRAVTHYKVLESFNGYSLCEFQLETGRTHQIRVHMASIGHPLLGDEIYGRTKSQFKTQGQALHAETIGFIEPGSNNYVEYHAEIPEYFTNILNTLRH